MKEKTLLNYESLRLSGRGVEWKESDTTLSLFPSPFLSLSLSLTHPRDRKKREREKGRRGVTANLPSCLVRCVGETITHTKANTT